MQEKRESQRITVFRIISSLTKRWLLMPSAQWSEFDEDGEEILEPTDQHALFLAAGNRAHAFFLSSHSIYCPSSLPFTE